MTDPTIPFQIPDDFAERARDMKERVIAGEPMTYQNLADALGLPFEFVAASISLTIALQTGQPVIVDPSALQPTH